MSYCIECGSELDGVYCMKQGCPMFGVLQEGVFNPGCEEERKKLGQYLGPHDPNPENLPCNQVRSLLAKYEREEEEEENTDSQDQSPFPGEEPGIPDIPGQQPVHEPWDPFPGDYWGDDGSGGSGQEQEQDYWSQLSDEEREKIEEQLQRAYAERQGPLDINGTPLPPFPIPPIFFPGLDGGDQDNEPVYTGPSKETLTDEDINEIDPETADEYDEQDQDESSELERIQEQTYSKDDLLIAQKIIQAAQALESAGNVPSRDELFRKLESGEISQEVFDRDLKNRRLVELSNAENQEIHYTDQKEDSILDTMIRGTKDLLGLESDQASVSESYEKLYPDGTIYTTEKLVFPDNSTNEIHCWERVDGTSETLVRESGTWQSADSSSTSAYDSHTLLIRSSSDTHHVYSTSENRAAEVLGKSSSKAVDMTFIMDNKLPVEQITSKHKGNYKHGFWEVK